MINFDKVLYFSMPTWLFILMLIAGALELFLLVANFFMSLGLCILLGLI